MTEQRIRDLLEALPTLRREALRLKRSGRDDFLEVNGLPDVTRRETIVDAVVPQLDQAFGELIPNAGSLISDYYRMMEIYGYLQRGGVAAERARMETMCTNAFWESMTTKVQHPARGMLGNMRANAETLLNRLKSLSAAEEAAVAVCKGEIDKVIAGRAKTRRKKRP